MSPGKSVSPRPDGRCARDNLGDSTLQTGDLDLDEIQNGSNLPRMLPDPGTPSKQEIEEHSLTHLPFRAWCPHCVAARAKDMKHLVDRWKQSGNTPVIGVDYAFMNKTHSDLTTMSSITTLVAKDQKSKHVCALPVPKKGVDEEEYATRSLLRCVNCLCYKKMVMKSDQEPAIIRLLEHLRGYKGSDIVQIGIEHSPVHDHQANGLVERAVQTIEAQTRTMVLALEDRVQTKIDPDDDVLPWLISYSGVLITDTMLVRMAKQITRDCADENPDGKSYNLVNVYTGYLWTTTSCRSLTQNFMTGSI